MFEIRTEVKLGLALEQLLLVGSDMWRGSGTPSTECLLVVFRLKRRRREMYCGHARLSVCLSAAASTHYCTDPDVTWGMVYIWGAPSYTLLGGFAIGARVALLWQYVSECLYPLTCLVNNLQHGELCSCNSICPSSHVLCKTAFLPAGSLSFLLRTVWSE